MQLCSTNLRQKMAPSVNTCILYGLAQGAISLYGIQDKDVELPDDPLKKEEIIKGMLFLEP